MSKLSFSWCRSLQLSLVSHMSTCECINYCSLPFAVMHLLSLLCRWDKTYPSSSENASGNTSEAWTEEKVSVISVPECFYHREHGHHERHAISDFSPRFEILKLCTGFKGFLLLFLVTSVYHWKRAAKPETFGSTQHTFVFKRFLYCSARVPEAPQRV